MSWSRPNPTYTRMDLPMYSIGTLPTASPTLLGHAHGRARDGGRVLIQVSGACTVTVYVWAPAGSGAWLTPSSASSSYQKTFAAAAMDFFDIPEGSLFYLKVDAGTITCYADCDPPQPTALR